MATVAFVTLAALAALAAAAFTLVSGDGDGDETVAEPPSKGPLIFNESFSGTSLDATRWSPCYHWTWSGCTNLANNELEWYIPEQVKVADGVLSLEATPRVVTGHQGRQFDYVSGLISGLSPQSTLFAFQYGYVEARVRIPKGRGLWPALWMLPTTRESLPEVDIFEMVGERPNVVQMHTHWGRGATESKLGFKFSGPDFTKRWHTFGLQWKPRSLTFYVDGIARWRVTKPEAIPHEPMYLITNLAVGGDFTTPPDETTPFPSSLKVDYIRVWRNA